MSNRKRPISNYPTAEQFTDGDFLLGLHEGKTSKFPQTIITSAGPTGDSGTSGTSGLSALGLPSKVIFTDNTGWTYNGIAGTNTKTFTFSTPFENTNYSADLIWQLADFDATAHSNSFQDNFGSIIFLNKTASSIDVEFDYVSADISGLPGFNARLVMVAEGESNGSGINGTSGTSGTSGSSGASGS